MAIVPMQKIGIVAHKSDFESLTDLLAELGIVQVAAHPEKSPEAGHDIENLLVRIERVNTFLADAVEKQPRPLTISYEQLANLAGEFDLEKTLDKVENDRIRLERLRAKETNLVQTIQNLEPYGILKYRLDQLADTDQVGIRLGFVPKTYSSEVIQKDRDYVDLCDQEELSSDANGSHVLITFHRSIEDDVDKRLADCEFARFHRGDLADTPAVELSLANEELAEVRDLIRDYEQSSRREGMELLPKLAALHGYLGMKLSEVRLSDLAERTEQTLYLTGWMKESDMKAIREDPPKRLESGFIEQIAPMEGEVPPVALKNPPVIEAFEVLTDLYGRPRRGMVDPTPFIAPFFPIFFGLCLTDAGYGLLLSLISAGLLAFGKLASGTRKFMRFILYSGIATVILGALAGGWFGIDLQASDCIIAKALLSIKIFDPLDNAIQFFAISIFLGVIQVSVGFALSGYVGYKESPNGALRVRSVLLALSWIAVTLGAGVFVANYLIPETMAPILGFGIGLLKFGALGIVGFSIILGIIGKRGVGGAIGDGLAFDGLYGIVGLFGDLLSYTRILALGLSTGVIAGVINIIAKQLSQMIPGVGIVFAALLVIVGHIAYTGLSALGAFVHPARLHFVEYFTKFYEGGGEPFTPFKRKIEGVKIEK